MQSKCKYINFQVPLLEALSLQQELLEFYRKP